ncbi:hypothetical protein CRYUN_Cryun12cG0001900 [Craigia yunnanensis]
MTMKMAKLSAALAFSVRPQEPELVVPAKPTPFEIKNLSDIDDQEGLRLREGPNCKLIVDCTAEGVLFIEADADIGLEQLGNTIQPPFPYVDEVPFDVPVSSGIVGCHLLSIQVICLICVGFIFAVRPNHAICVIGLVQFLDAIREMVRGADKPSQLPVWQREIFSA